MRNIKAKMIALGIIRWLLLAGSLFTITAIVAWGGETGHYALAVGLFFSYMVLSIPADKLAHDRKKFEKEERR